MADHSRSSPSNVSPIDSPPRSYRPVDGSMDRELLDEDNDMVFEEDADDEKQRRKDVYKEPRAHRASRTGSKTSRTSTSKNGTATAAAAAAAGATTMTTASRSKKEVELEHLEKAESRNGKGKGTKTRTKPRKAYVAMLRRHCGRFWICYLIATIVLLAILLPLLFLKIIPALAQLIVDKTSLPIYYAVLKAVSNEQVIVSLQTALDVPAGLGVSLDPTLLGLYNADTPGGGFWPYTSVTLAAQYVTGHTVITVSDYVAPVGNRTELRKWLRNTVYNTTTDVSVRGDTTAFLGQLRAPIHLDKTVTIPALQQLRGVRLDTLTLKLPPEADGTNLRGTITLPNWSILTMGLGNLTLNAWAGSVLIGNATVLDVLLPPGNTTLPFHGTIAVEAVVANLASVLASQTKALATGNLELGVSGNQTLYNGEHIVYIEEVLNDLKLYTQVPVVQALGDVLSGFLGGNVTLQGILQLIVKVLGSGALGDLLGNLGGFLGGLNLTRAADVIMSAAGAGEEFDVDRAAAIIEEDVVLPSPLGDIVRRRDVGGVDVVEAAEVMIRHFGIPVPEEALRR